MKLHLHRIARREGYTIGRLYVDGRYFCDTLEDTDRGLSQDQPLDTIKARKRYGATAIPTGRYALDINTPSPRFGQDPFYKQSCDGRVPRLRSVPGFLGVLIHAGNTASDTEGCILLGENKVKGGVINSRAACARLYKLLRSKPREQHYIFIE